MNYLRCAAVVVATGTLAAQGVGAAASQRPTPNLAPVIAAAYGRNDALQSYTFQVSIEMAMRHFPWLHFKMEGVGDYLRGDHYLVHLTKKPGFASKMKDIDLSMIDPSMWPKRYRYEQAGVQDGDTLFALQSTQKPSSLQSATVALNPAFGAQWVDVTYSDGTHIHLNVTSNTIFGFLLPTSLTADVYYPHMSPLSADASFSNYAITDPVPQQ